MVKVQKFNIQDHKIKCLIYGESGSGKTVFGSTAPNPFWLSAEGGLASVIETHPIGIEIKSIKDLKDAYNYIKSGEYKKDGFEIDTVIIDSITEINEIIKDEIKIKKGGRDMEGKDWGKVGDEIKFILRQFRDLDKHIIFIALAKESKDEEKIDKIVPMLNGQTARDIAAYMDLVCFIGIDKTGNHYILTKGNQKYLTKDRFNQFPNDIEPNFSIMQGYIENIKISKNELVRSFDTKEEIQFEEKLPEVNQIGKITAKQTKDIITTWNSMWELSTELYSTELDSKGEIKYTKDKCDAVRGVTMKSITGTNTTTNMSFEQAELFLSKINEKIKKLQEEKMIKQNEFIEKPSEIKEKESKMIKDTLKKKATKKTTKK